ncbi:hypothetical protein [Streptomyces sviceus]|uniref:hypothetical protein n=1 Tax=Streptomyces sviceus TaxID=285530 RepID=UPI00367FC615
MPRDPAQDRPREKILISPRYLAASLPTDHHQLLDIFAEEAAWSAHYDDSSLAVTSPCGRVTIRHDQAIVGRGPHMVISTRSDEADSEAFEHQVRAAVPDGPAALSAPGPRLLTTRPTPPPAPRAATAHR